LATVYGFIKQSGGYVSVESEVSKGTSFNVFLPQAAKAKEETPVDTSLRTSRIGAETILLVEDEDIVRKLGYDVLTASGYKVIEAAGGVEALEICANENLEIDLLLTDVVMPQMNGRELWEKLAAERPEMKVLFTSGYTDDMVVRSGIRNEETNFLQKPFAIDTLIEKVRQVLDSDGVIERSTINGEEFAIRG
jgi:DNA-binding NtrC family response regulator